MKNLENKEILSDEILEAIDIVYSRCPNAVFGGSIALNAIGLINRKISDIDLFFSKRQSLNKHEFLSLVSGEILSDTVTNTNGREIQRTGAKIANIKTCVFSVDDEELQHSKHKFTRNGKDYEICIQNVNYAIEAKKAYSSRNPKHQTDLENIESFLDGLL
jgi:hypothetical protein